MHNHTKRSGTRRCSLLACLAFVALLQNSCCFKVDLEALGGSEDISLRPNNRSSANPGSAYLGFPSRTDAYLSAIRPRRGTTPFASRSAWVCRGIRSSFKQVCLVLPIYQVVLQTGLPGSGLSCTTRGFRSRKGLATGVNEKGRSRLAKCTGSHPLVYYLSRVSLKLN